jgi:alkylation response protein AidB-like acyl-CoA dehydrogenase
LSVDEFLKRAEVLAGRFAERAAEYDRTAGFPKEDVDDLRAEGFLGLLVPSSLGGAGAGFRDYVGVAMTLARGSPATALLYNMHAAVTGGLAGIPEALALALGAPPTFFEVRDRVLRAAAEGSMYGVAITEPEAGSRLSAMRTTYEPSGDRYRIRGFKSVVSGAGYLDAYLVAARAAESGGEEPVVSYFLVPAGDGLMVEETWDPLGMRATISNGLHLDVRVGADALIGGVEGLVLPLAYTMPQWLVASYAAVYVGVGQGAIEEAVRYMSERVVAGERGGLGRLPSVRARLGRADAEIEGARLAVEEAARLVDERPGEPDTNRAIFRAKLLAGDAAMRVASSLTEACGLGALQRGQPLERLLRDGRMGALMPPSSDVCAAYLGVSALGLDPMTSQDPRPW